MYPGSGHQPVTSQKNLKSTGRQLDQPSRETGHLSSNLSNTIFFLIFFTALINYYYYYGYIQALFSFEEGRNSHENCFIGVRGDGIL